MVGIVLSDRQREAIGEVFYFGPFGPRRERGDHMHPLATRHHRESLKTDRLQGVTKSESGRADRVKIQALVGVEVEDKPVCLFDILDTSTPSMELDRPHLDARHQPVGVVDIEVRLLMAILLNDADVMDLVAEAPCVMLLEEAFLGPALGTP